MIGGIGSGLFIPPVLAAPKATEEAVNPALENPENSADPQTQNAIQALETLTESQNKSGDNPNELNEEEEKQVQELKQADQEVRSHEQAHKTIAGAYAGAIQFETVTGPDGVEYAVAGEVPIDSSPIPNNPEATVRKMDVVVRAALAPSEPSSQDFAVARAAQAARIQAQAEARELKEAEQNEDDEVDLLDPQAQQASHNLSKAAEATQEIVQALVSLQA